MALHPTVVLDPLESPDGGFTDAELCALQAMAQGAGAGRVYLWTGRLLSDAEVLAAPQPCTQGEWHQFQEKVQMNPMAQAYYDRQYNARASVQDALAYMARYAQESQVAFNLPGAVRNQRYSPRSTDILDIYLTQKQMRHGQGAPVFIFIHGGYWKALSKDDSAFMAPALTQAGAVVVVPDYDLAPAVTLDHIVDQMRQAYAWVVHNIAIYGGDARNICVCGSSAGGQLVGMLLAKGWQEDYDLPVQAAPASAFALSGLFDLQPLLTTHINNWMQLDDAAVMRNSPRFLLPDASTHSQCQLRVACGEFEGREFQRQSQEYLAAWQARCLPGQRVEAPATNHFDLPLQLADPHSIVHQTALDLMGLLA